MFITHLRSPRVLNYWVDREFQEDFFYRDATTWADFFTILISWYTFRASLPQQLFLPLATTIAAGSAKPHGDLFADQTTSQRGGAGGLVRIVWSCLILYSVPSSQIASGWNDLFFENGDMGCTLQMDPNGDFSGDHFI